jgi:hypothetical protein
MGSIWLKSMCDDRGSTRADMIEIVISLALLKLRFDLFIFCKTNTLYDVIFYFDDG